MRGGAHEDRTVLIDASVFITLANLDSVSLLENLEGSASMPMSVVEEIKSEPARSELDKALNEWIGSSTLVKIQGLLEEWEEHLERAADHLGAGSNPENWGGDVPLLAVALHAERPIVITDDKPLRKTCKVLSIPVSGTIGVIVHAVESGNPQPEEAKAKLAAMDEVGARLSASLLRRAERMIDDADVE